LQADLSAINVVHNDFEYPQPVCGLRPNASSRADSCVFLTAINAQVYNSTLSINQAAKNIARNQAAPSSRMFSAQGDPNKLRWKILT
jgi:hypothetical protein